MERGLFASLALVVALVALVPAAAGIKCFHCNSATDPGCQNVNANETASQSYLKDCKDDNNIPQEAQPFCRKIVQTILAGGDRRVIRKCGYEKSPKPCYHYDDDDHAEVVCQCFEDACNAAPGVHRDGVLARTLTAAASAAILLLLSH